MRFVTRSIPQRGISLPVRASLPSKEEPCPLRPHRGFLIPCPSPSIDNIHHVCNDFRNASKDYSLLEQEDVKI
ncbi:MAG: hypothetical protein R6V00_13435 [Candidatus Aminicenantes bacterium]